MEKIEISLLKSELYAHIREIERLYADIEGRKKGAKRSKTQLESLAYKLHNLYCAFEDLFKTVARHFENRVEDIARYHKELLRKMTLQIEGVRPALLSEEAFKALDELRAFKHFFRHAYAYELKYQKIKLVLESADRVKDLYKGEIERFLKELEESNAQNSIA